MDARLFGRALAKFSGGLLLMGLLLFLPAGTLRWRQAWLLMGLLFLSMPLVLGSAISFGILLAYIPIIAARIRNEERVLEQGLEGYAEYERRVRYRLIPFVW